MKKTGQIRQILLVGSLLFSSLHAGYQDNISPQFSSRPLVFSTAEGKQWVEQCIRQHPEILWLASDNVRKTEEGQATRAGPYSEQLFGQKYMEFDRTIMTLRSLKLILDGSDKAYHQFTADQSLAIKLSHESFKTLHLQGQKLLKSKWKEMNEKQIAQAMEAALILGDIGKSEKARELLKPYGVQAPDFVDFHEEAMPVIAQHPHLCPSFARLPSPLQQLLVDTANLAHYGHIFHLEGGTALFSKLKQSSVATNDPFVLSFDLFVHTCDVAGALGHINNHSSLIYTEPTHQATQAIGHAVKVLSDPSQTEWDAYHAYLITRASWLGLNPNNPLDRVLARIGAMMRLFTLEEGAILKKAVLELGKSSRQKIITQLAVQKENLQIRTPTYMPTLLVNLLNNTQLGASREKRLSKAIKIGLPFIARVLQEHKELLASQQANPQLHLNFNKAAAVAKLSPELLDQEFMIDKEGYVNLAPASILANAESAP